MSRTEITHLKIARYPELLTGPARPIHWDVDPSTACDHRCRGCPYIYDGAAEGAADPMLGVVRPETAPNKRTLLDFTRFLRFLEEAKALGTRAITFVGGGEPTLHPHFAEMMESTHAHGIKFGVITHLGRIYKAEFFAALGLATWVRASINAGTRETYARHQGRDVFEDVMANLATAKAHGIRVGVSFLVTDENYLEIERATRLVQKRGAAFIQFKPLVEVDLGRTYYGIEAAIADELARARALASDEFQVLDQWSGRLAELRRHAAHEFGGPCWVQRFNPKLGANGVAYVCCELAYSVEGAIGSIYDEPLEAILQRAAQRQIDMAGCPHCWSKPVNAAINAGKFSEISAPPESVDQEFV